MREQKRILYLILGWMFVALGAAGLILPLLPTTPFILLASSCFLRSSPRFRDWLLRNRWFGPSIRDWEERKAVRRSVKVVAVLTVMVVIGLVIVRPTHWGIRTAVIVLGLVGIGVIWKLPVVGKSEARNPKPETNSKPK